MSVNVNMTNGTQLSGCSYNPTAEKIGKTFAYCLIFVVSLAGNIFIGIIVYKTKSMRKPINFLIVNMAVSDLLYPTFLIPERLVELYLDSWLISGPLGQVLCKLATFLINVSMSVSFQSLVLIAVDRFGISSRLWYFLSVLRSSVQSCAFSSFSPLGSSLWLSGPLGSLPKKLLNIQGD